jgi:hypothetical protein
MLNRHAVFENFDVVKMLGEHVFLVEHKLLLDVVLSGQVIQMLKLSFSVECSSNT